VRESESVLMAKESIETLVSELVHEEDWRRMRATAACVSGGPRAVQALIHALQTGSSALKAEAAAMLARMSDPQGGVPLVGLLQDEDEAVRKAAASALDHMAGVLDETTAAALTSLLYASKDEGIRMTASQLLGVIPNAIAPLCTMLAHEDPEAQIMAAEMLEHLLDPRSADAFIHAMGQPAVRGVEALMQRLRVDKDTGVKELAMKSLGLIGDARPAQLYIEAIPVRPLRVYAMEALAKVKDVEVLRPYKELFDRLRTDRDGLV